MFYVGPIKVKAHKSFLFFKGSHKVWNKEHLFDIVVTIYFFLLCFSALCSSKVSLSTFQFGATSKVCDGNDDRVSKTDKSCYICSMRLKSVLVRYENYGTLSIYHLSFCVDCCKKIKGQGCKNILVTFL